MAADTTDSRSEADLIERDIERIQDEMGETVQKLEEKLTPREMARSVIGDQNSDLAKEALHIVRSNPIPAAMIAIGAVWLLATSNSPSVARLKNRIIGRSSSPQPGLRPRSAEPAPIGPPPTVGEEFERRPTAPFVD